MKIILSLLAFFLLTASTTYAPTRNDDFDSRSLQFNATGVQGIAAHGTASNIDMLVSVDSIMTGGNLILKNQCFGDTVDEQVVDVDNILGYGAGTVLRQFITSWNVADDVQIQGGVVVPGYPAKIISGLYLRLIYHSTCNITDVNVAVNYLLHKVML